MAWVMHSEVTRRPWCCRFYIGSIEIARIEFVNKRPWLFPAGFDRCGPFNSVSDAMKTMHELLNNPPPIEGPNDNVD